MAKISALRNALAEAAGTEIAEAALVLPIMFMLLLGIYWFGRAFNTYETINHAAIEAAHVAALGSCATCARPVNTDLAGIAALQVLQAADLNPLQATEIPGETVVLCGGGPATCNPANVYGGPDMCVYYDVQLNSTGPQACGVYVSFEFPYQFSFPFTSLNGQRLRLKARAQFPGEY
jgi:Flp pilus assembly protein TadG